jgi:hypothetical protein
MTQLLDTRTEWFDATLYPDIELPETLEELSQRVDFIARLCGAWDFGILPRWATINEIRQPFWREAIDACRLLTSPTYHLLRELHNLPQLSYLGREFPYIRDDPYLEMV